MNILFVGPRYYPYLGGVEYVIKSVAENLTKLGHNVTVLTGDPGIEKMVEEDINKVRVIRWPTISFGNAYHIPRRRESLNEMLSKLVKEFDIIHVHSVHAVFPIYVTFYIKKNNPLTKLVVTFHYHATGHTLLRKLFWRFYWIRKIDYLVHIVNKIHAVSNYEASLIINHYPHAKEKLVVIPNGVNEDVFQYEWKGQNSTYMIYAGRIEKYKRLELAINLSKELNLDLIIIGEGAYKKKLKKYVEKQASKRVKFLPPQPRWKYLSLLANARYAINPSQYEAFSIFIAEAFVIGVPIIISPIIAKILGFKTFKCILRNRSLVIPDYKRCNKRFVRSWREIVKQYLSMYTMIENV